MKAANYLKKLQNVRLDQLKLAQVTFVAEPEAQSLKL
jgi:hypothetical protein